MTQFAHSADGYCIAFDAVGEPPWVLLLHGFASSRRQNWEETGWYPVLRSAGRGILALDFRGHGDSDKPHEPACYGERLLKDALAVLAAQNVSLCDVFGYSMGGSAGLLLASRFPHLVRRLIVAGVGETYLDTPLPADTIAKALEAAEADGDAPLAARFRLFADQPGKDRLALAACVRALPPRLTPQEMAAIPHPVLVMAGSRDPIAGAPGPLAATLPRGRAHSLPDRNHMTAVGDLDAKRTVQTFLSAPAV